MTLTRRTFVAGASAGLVSTMLPGCGRKPETADVIVIGAGLAGLQTARLLEQAGATVVVLEASARLGGRVQTLSDRPGGPELGAADIGPVYSRVLETAAALNLTPEPWPGGMPSFWFHVRGQGFTADQWPDLDINTFEAKLKKVNPSGAARPFMPRPNPLPDLGAWLTEEFARYDVPYGQFLVDQGAPPDVLEYARVGAQFADLNDISALWMLRGGRVSAASMRMAFAEGKPVRYFMPGGMSRLIAAMATSLTGDVRLNHRVTALDQDASSITVSCANGAQLRGQFAVCTMPLPVLRQVAITPALTETAAAAVQQIPYGAATSVVFHVHEPFWEEDELPANMWTDTPIQRAFLNPSPTGEGDHLWVFTTGAADLSQRGWPDEEIARFVLEQLGKLRPSTQGRLELSGVRAWTRDPFVLGTYASRAPGQIRQFGNSLAAPQNRLVFAGEHTAERYAGMEGAMESAQRAAALVSAS